MEGKSDLLQELKAKFVNTFKVKLLNELIKYSKFID